MKKRITALLATLLVTTMLTSCINTLPADNKDGSVKDSRQKIVTIVTTLFPQYDFARQIAGEKADVTLLLPPGVESHSYEPTPADIVKINSAQLFIYTGKEMEIWADRIINGIDNKALTVLPASEGIQLSESDEPEDIHEGESEDDHQTHLANPHIWTDPSNAAVMVKNITTALTSIDPENSSYYTKNANTLLSELDKLDTDLKSLVANKKRDEVVFGGRNAFYYLLKRYSIQYKSAYDSCATEAEPSARIVAELIDEIKSKSIPVIFYEELIVPKVAKSIADETGAKMLLLHSCHNLTKDELSKGESYLSIMKQNVENLKEALW